MKIQIAMRAHIPALRRALALAHEEMSARFATPGEPGWLADAVCRAVEDGQGVVVATNDAGDLSGFVAWVALPGWPAGAIQGLGTWVAPAERRTGLATAMRELAIGWWRTHGGKTVEGVAHAANLGGVASAKAAGFEVAGYLMRREL